ncbi:MAG: hypothetical protein ACRDGM_19850, partial [bacterium]
PYMDPGGILGIQGSMLLLGRDGIRRIVSPRMVKLHMRLALRRAANTGKVFVLWFHPSNFYAEPDAQFAIFEAVLRQASAMRDAHVLLPVTMALLASEYPGGRA